MGVDPLTAGIIGGGSIISGLIGSSSSRDAARAQAAGQQAGIDEQRRQFDTLLGLTEPQREVGNAALGVLGQAFIPGFGDGSVTGESLSTQFRNLPGAQFAVNEATRNLNNSFAARGGALSGNALSAIGDRTANIASNTIFNGLGQLAGIGQVGTNTAAQGALNSGNNIANLLAAQGNARASGINASGASINNALQGGLSNLVIAGLLN